MTVAPKLPKLDPGDMAWARWVTSNVQTATSTIGQLDSRLTAANVQRAAIAGAVGNTNQNTKNDDLTKPQIPEGPPQTPTGPELTSDHGTVTIRWDGNVTTNGVVATPYRGFAYITVYRSIDGLIFVPVGNRVGIAGTVVDSDVLVGQTYFYRLVTTDTLGQNSAPSVVLSIVVKGVDLGSLDQDVHDALDDIRHSATTGGLVSYAATAPSDPAYHSPRAIWFDTSGTSGAIAKRWDDTTQTWVPVPLGAGALGPGSVVATNILAGAIDTYHLGAGIVTAANIEAGAVTTEKLEANSVTTNKIAAGSIDADRIAVGAIDANKLSLSAALPTGTQVNRVPRTFSDAVYWFDVINGLIELAPHSPRTSGGARGTTGGIVFDATGGAVTITTELAVPTSRQLHTTWVASGTVTLRIAVFNSAYGVLRYEDLPNGTIYSFLPTDSRYAVVAEAAGSTLLQASVFEVIGGAIGSKQAAQLSPSGLRLFNDEGQLSVDLSTSTTNFFTILNNTEAVLTLDENGNGNFNSVQVNDDFYFESDRLVGSFTDYQRSDGLLDGPLLNRLPRGVHYAATWDSMNDYVISAQYQRIATGAFSLNADRSYTLETNLSGIQARNDFNVNCYVELQLSTTPLTSVTSGTVVARSVVFATDSGYWQLEPAFFTSPTNAGFNTALATLPPNTDIYWQINTNMSSAPAASSKLAQFAYNPTFRVIDQGPAIQVLDGTDRSTSGGTATGGAGSGTGGNSTGSGSSTTTTKTKTWDATWSASWNQNGGNRVSGSGTYTDADRLYQGFGASNMGAKIGFPASVASTLSGKTVVKVELFMQNRWTYNNAGGTATLAAHGSTSAGSTFGSTSGGSFTRSFDRGQGRWLNISNGEIPFSSWKSGSVRGVALVVEGGATNYAYYDGVGKSKPPKLRVTYK